MTRSQVVLLSSRRALYDRFRFLHVIRCSVMCGVFDTSHKRYRAECNFALCVLGMGQKPAATVPAISALKVKHISLSNLK